jgi:MFS family permease
MGKSFDISGKHYPVLRVLAYPQYRLLWISSLSTWVGRWMEMVVGAWFVLELTDSPFQIGLLGACRFAATVLGPFCGTVCDHFNRRTILLAVQIVYGVASATMLALFASAEMEVWHLFVFSSIGGLCYTFDYAARYSIAANLVSKQDIVSSISLLQVANGITFVVGPLIGGSMLEIIGATGCFTLIAASFLVSFIALLPVKIEEKKGTGGRGTILGEFLSGLRYMKKDRLLLSLLLMAAMANLFIYPYNYSLMPIFARHILGTGASGFGQLLAAAGVGTVLGSLLAGTLPRSISRGRLLVGAILVWPVILMAVGFSKSFPLSLALQMAAGIAQGTAMVLIQALLLIWSTEEMYGRISGTRAFAISTLSPGNFLTGYEASLWGAPAALVTNCSIFILMTTLLILWAPELVRRK